MRGALAVRAAVLLVLGGVGALDARGRPTAAEVQRRIDAEGAREALHQLFSESETLLADGIASGGAGWLHIAEQLRPVSDGATAEVLAMAIQEALPRNPTGVLHLVRRGSFSARDACGMYGFGQIEDQRPTKVLLGLVDVRVSAVRDVQVSSLAKEQRECLAALASLRLALEKR